MKKSRKKQRKSIISVVLESLLLMLLSFIFCMFAMIYNDGTAYRKVSAETIITAETQEPLKVEDEVIQHDEEPIQSAEETETQQTEEVKQVLYEKLSDNDRYLLAKIVQCEAGNKSVRTRELVALTVLNRVKSNKFPNTIYDVIFQHSGKVYQFSPIVDGAWKKKEPESKDYEAVDNVLNTTYDYSEGSLYFEDCKNPNNWHSRNLTFILKSQGMRFYK